MDKENNKKVMCFPKKTKDKELENQSQCLAGIICLFSRAKHQQDKLWVLVDGVKWNSVTLPCLALPHLHSQKLQPQL